MEKIVMPKNSALLNEIEAVLKIYYEAGEWLSNEDYKEKLKELIGADQYSSSYTKKSQITSYFGFTEWEDITNTQSRRRITTSGKKMYEALITSDESAVQEIIMDALETVKFGRNNFGVPSSNSDVEPPSLFIRAILDLNYLNYSEFAYLLNSIVDNGNSYTESIDMIKEARNQGGVKVPEVAQKYVDCKPIMMLVRWGFLQVSEIEEIRGVIIKPAVLQKFEKRLRNLMIYNVDKFTDEGLFEAIEQHLESRKEGGENTLFYGVPGSGKSHAIDESYGHERMTRVVFHPDYMNTDFIGQILPTIKEDETISYEFKPGPFTKVLKNSYNDPSNMYYLVIEEINRGNAPAIFGEIFQLLDRTESGESKYSVVNYDIAKEVFGDDSVPIKIPSNLTFLATMNTSDQNVFTLDTAFQRRWNMKMIRNNIDVAKHKNVEIADTGVTWGVFNKVINDLIIGSNGNMLSSEDKRLGAYFISPADLKRNDIATRFSEKVVKYLWDDAFKFSRDKLFDTTTYKSLEDIIVEFLSKVGNDRFIIFKDEVIESLLSRSEFQTEMIEDKIEK
ncbi:AAA family ATPase [Streptococcus suis]|uniref:Restriction endonuclease n=1 Tax=Streptococcus suis TaxID=1307 RepID=A0A3R8NKM6_STRSU|nr:AAA family ATPase [Streptococcus suis]RRN50545.1 restriction endonuclease [Streptococcus suis]HEL2150946.1 AAA family ATPase [Streptococcus suis]